MAEEVERSAASVEEAIEAALDELGVTEQEALVEIVQEPRGGFLGLGSQGAVVRVRRRDAPPTEEELGRQAEVAAEFLNGLLERMKLDADVETNLVDGTMYVEIWGPEDEDEMGLLIGRHGQTLDSIQELVRAAVHRELQTRCLVLVDVEDYRKRRLAQLTSRAREAARNVQSTGREQALEPMSAFERKVVHDAVAQMGGLETESEGEDPNRRVVIRTKA